MATALFVDKNALYNYKGKKMSYEQVIKALGQASDGPQAEKVFSKYFEMGVVQEIAAKGKDAKVQQKVEHQIITDAAVEILNAEEAAAVRRKRQNNIEERGLLVEDEVKFSIQRQLHAMKASEYLDQRGIHYDAAQDLKTGDFVFTLYQVTVPELNALDRFLKAQEMVITMKKFSGKAADGTSVVLKGAVSATGAITSAVANVAVQTTGQLVSALTKVGAETVNAGATTFKKQVTEMANDRSVMEAKQTLNGWFNAARRKMGGGQKSSRFF